MSVALNPMSVKYWSCSRVTSSLKTCITGSELMQQIPPFLSIIESIRWASSKYLTRLELLNDNLPSRAEHKASCSCTLQNRCWHCSLWTAICLSHHLLLYQVWYSNIWYDLMASLLNILLLTEFEVRTVSYGPSFSTQIYGSSTNHKSEQKKQLKQTFEFSGLYSRVQPVKLTNHSARTNWEI